MNPLNTSIQSNLNGTSFKLNFAGKTNQLANPFMDNTLKAVEFQTTKPDADAVVHFKEQAQIATTANYVSLKVADETGNKGEYVVVDTVYVPHSPAVTATLPQFGYDSFKTITVTATNTVSGFENGTYVSAPAIGRDKGVYEFMFTLDPSANAINIEALARQDKGPKVTATDGSGSWSTWNYVSTAIVGATDATAAAVGPGAGNVKYDFVKLTDAAIVATLTNQNTATRISLGTAPAGLNVATIAEGVYLIQNTVSGRIAAEQVQNGYYRVDNYTSGKDYAVWAKKEVNQDFVQMPSTQWVVTRPNMGGAMISAKNRETGKDYIAATQYYQVTKGNNDVVYNLAGDTLTLTNITAEVAKDTKGLMGYQPAVNEFDYKAYAFKYLPTLADNKFVNAKSDNFLALDITGEKMYFNLDSIDGMHAYGVKATFAPTLQRVAYRLKVSSSDKTSTIASYVVLDANGKYKVAEVTKDKAAVFFLKEFNRIESTPYYALVDTGLVVAPIYQTTKVGVDDNTLDLRNELIASENRTSSFALADMDDDIYRRFNTIAEGTVATDAPDTVRFYRNNNNQEFLYEDANSVYSKGKGINFLGVRNDKQFKEADSCSYSIYVDTAYVRYNTPMPQYMLAVDPEIVKGSIKWCGEDHATLADSMACPHTKITPSFVRARYLFNATDSVKNTNYLWNDNYVRLAFIDGVHMADTFYILRGANAGIATDKIDFNNIPAADRVLVGDKNVHNKYKFSFRLVNKSEEKPFMIESEGDKIIPSNNKGSWVKIQNGVPVIAKMASFQEALLQAEIFNVTKDVKYAPTKNDDITANTVSVVAGNGNVTVKNAEGKVVTITNILGQSIANTVVTSDNATISVPTGIVVVAVEGETAVKAIVK